MEEKSRKATHGGADLEAIASWQEAHIFRAINQRKSYREGFVDGAKWMLEHPTGGELLHVCNKTAEITKKKMIDKACDVYCKLCDTKECVDDECNWVKKFRKAMEK